MELFRFISFVAKLKAFSGTVLSPIETETIRIFERIELWSTQFYYQYACILYDRRNIVPYHDIISCVHKYYNSNLKAREITEIIRVMEPA